MSEGNGKRAWGALLAGAGAVVLGVFGWLLASTASAQSRLAVVEARQERAAQDMDRLGAELRETREAISALRADLARVHGSAWEGGR